MDKEYIKQKVENVKDTLKRQGLDSEESLNNIWVLPYYIITFNNKTFEKAVSNLATNTEEVIKLTFEINEEDMKNLLELHRILNETFKILKNNNYLISMFFRDYDKEVSQNLKSIANRDTFFKSNLNSTLYSPGGNPNILIYATPIMYYSRQISNIKRYLNNISANDIQYISINDFNSSTTSTGLVDSMKINLLLNNFDRIIDIIESKIK